MIKCSFKSDGATVWVSGASRGIGREIALGFAQIGATVVFTGDDLAALQAVKGQFNRMGVDATALECDLRDLDSIRAAVQEVHCRLGGVDVLINVAGVSSGVAACEKIDMSDFDHNLSVNLRGAFALTQAVGERMIERRSGSVLSIASVQSCRPMQGLLAYAVSKSGLAQMTRALAAEWGRHNIRVNAIAPGFVVTEMTKSRLEQAETLEWANRVVPLQRYCSTEDVVQACMFVASQAAGYITGQIVYVDGGFTSHFPWPVEL